MSLTHDTNHAAEARARLCQQFIGNTGINALLDANSEQTQAIEDALWTLQTARLPITTAAGVQLDGIGDIVGQPRNGLSDAAYRPWLEARMLANVSGGETERLIRIVELLNGGTGLIHVAFGYPASLTIDTGGVLVADLTEIAAIIRSALAAGVNLGLIYSETDPAHTFTFSSDDTEQASTDQGWADDAQTSGGYWADVA